MDTVRFFGRVHTFARDADRRLGNDALQRSQILLVTCPERLVREDDDLARYQRVEVHEVFHTVQVREVASEETLKHADERPFARAGESAHGGRHLRRSSGML